MRNSVEVSQKSDEALSLKPEELQAMRAADELNVKRRLCGRDFLRCITHGTVNKKGHIAELMEKVKLDMYFFLETVIGRPYVMRNYKRCHIITRLRSYISFGNHNAERRGDSD
jgi:hypothetical protein